MDLRSVLHVKIADIWELLRKKDSSKLTAWLKINARILSKDQLNDWMESGHVTYVMAISIIQILLIQSVQVVLSTSVNYANGTSIKTPTNVLSVRKEQFMIQ